MEPFLDLQPRIYVACLAAYNSGCLHGAWIDADQDAEAIHADIDAMLRRSPIPDAEEYAIHDHAGFVGFAVGEFTPIEQVARIAQFLAEHGALGGAVLEHFNGDLDEAATALEEGYRGLYEALADYVQELTEETTLIPQSLRNYIDWGAMARDAELNGDFFTIEKSHNAVYVFAAC
jgi:antirestriction protein